MFRQFPNRASSVLGGGALWLRAALLVSLAFPCLSAADHPEDGAPASGDSVVARLSEALGIDPQIEDGLKAGVPIVAYRSYAAAAAILSENRGQATGETVLTQEALARAAGHLHKALDAAPNFAAAHYLLGLMEARRRRYAAALASFRSAVRIGPALAKEGALKALFLRTVSDCQASAQHVAQGTQYLDRRKYREALTAYREAVRLMPDFAEAHANLGLVYMLIGNAARAVAEQQEAIRLKPDLAEAHYNLGNAYARQGRYTEAVPAYRAAIRLRPDDAPADSIVAKVDAGQGTYTEQVARHQGAMRHSGLANAYFNLGDYLAAIAEYRRVLDIEPDFTDGHYNLGVLYERMGNRDRAIFHWETYLKLAENDSTQKAWIADASVRLDRLKGQNR